MRSQLLRRLGCSLGPVCILFLFTPAFSVAAQYVIDGRQAQSDFLPGAFVGLADPNGTDYMANGEDSITGLPVHYYSYAAVLDTGASGSVISAYDADVRSIPMTTEKYSDVGIGGTEWFNVSQSTRLKMSPVTVGVDGSEVKSNFSSYGDYKFQIRQSDPALDDYDPVYVNVVGTPVLNQHVMHVMSSSPSFSWSSDVFGGVPVEYVPTELLASAPLPLNAASSQLVLVQTTGNVLHVPLTYQNFISGSAPVNTSTNPMIAGVQVNDHRKPTGQQSSPSDWLFDSGAGVTMVGRNLAVAIGIDLDHETPVADTTVIGIGGDIRTFNGYQVDNLVIPLNDGNQLVFSNIVVFVPGADDLPADLPGVFGMNLLNSSFSGVDMWGDYLNLTDSAFSDWYVVPVPEPATIVLLAIGAAMLLLRRFKQLRRAS